MADKPASNDALWSSDDNWNGSFYFAKADTRVLVPKRPSNISWGWTLNLGHPTTEAAVIVGILVVPIVAVAVERGWVRSAMDSAKSALGLR